MEPSAVTQDLEQEQLLEQQQQPQKRTTTFVFAKRAVLPAAFGVALLLSAAVAFGTSFFKPAVVPRDAGSLDGLIQDFAAQRGSPLTEAQVHAVKDELGRLNLERSSLRLANSTLGSDLDLRSLHGNCRCYHCDCNYDGDDDDDNDDDDDKGNGGDFRRVSRKCRKALRKSVKRSLRSMAQLAVDHFLDCVWGDKTSQECRATRRRVDSFETRMKRRCRRSGDICSVIETHCGRRGVRTQETEQFCMPQECHDQLNIAMDLVTKLLRDQEFKDAVASGHGADHAKGYDIKFQC